MTEIAFIPAAQGKVAGQFPGIFIFTGAARMMRPVFNIAARAIEYIGTLEQVSHQILQLLSLKPR
jgi:DNA-directed RNA polymerase I subunit RPA2